MQEETINFGEPLWRTLVRNIAIAAVAGAIAAFSLRQPSSTGRFALLALWLSLGGHCVELVYLHFLRGRFPRRVDIAVRFAFWFAAGCVLFLGMRATAPLLSVYVLAPQPVWIGGLLFLGIELIAHLALFLRRRPNFYSGTA